MKKQNTQSRLAVKLNYNSIWLVVILFILTLYSLESLSQDSDCNKKSPLVVAIIDTGADLNHESIKPWLWKNPGESGLDKYGNNKETNGIDDDDNGFVDDFHGWNFVSNSSDLSDHHGHGSHIAGLITRDWHSYVSTKSCPEIQIMILKYYDQRFPQSDTLENSTMAMQYAIRNKVKIINFSGGGNKKSKREEMVLLEALKNNILITAAAGNDSSDSDLYKFYPSSYNLPNILSVAALNTKNMILPSSNYGIKSVKIAASGENILSSLPNNSFGLMSGTSQATAITAGIAALVLHKKPWLENPVTLISELCNTGTLNLSLKNKTKNSMQINLNKSLHSNGYHVSATGRKIQNTQILTEKNFLDQDITSF